MLKDNIIKYYFYKFKFLICKPKFKRDPFRTIFNVQILNKTFHGEVGKLITFVEAKYPIKIIDVKFVHNIINWNDFYRNLSSKEKNILENFHMNIVVNSKLNYPIIVTANIDGKITNILDGLHRIKKAYLLKRDTINAYIIPENDLFQI